MTQLETKFIICAQPNRVFSHWSTFRNRVLIWVLSFSVCAILPPLDTLDTPRGSVQKNWTWLKMFSIRHLRRSSKTILENNRVDTHFFIFIFCLFLTFRMEKHTIFLTILVKWIWFFLTYSIFYIKIFEMDCFTWMFVLTTLVEHDDNFEIKKNQKSTSKLKVDPPGNEKRK